MFMRNFVNALKKPIYDPITEVMSQAKQQHEVAAKKLDDTFCKVLDGPGCECRTLQVTSA